MGYTGRKLWYTDKLPFTSYTTFTPHSCVRRDFHAYVTSCIEYTTYKITVTCIECANVRASDQKKLKGSRSWKLDHCMSAESTVKRLKERIKQVMNNHSIEIDQEQQLFSTTASCTCTHRQVASALAPINNQMVPSLKDAFSSGIPCLKNFRLSGSSIWAYSEGIH